MTLRVLENNEGAPDPPGGVVDPDDGVLAPRWKEFLQKADADGTIGCLLQMVRGFEAVRL